MGDLPDGRGGQKSVSKSNVTGKNKQTTKVSDNEEDNDEVDSRLGDFNGEFLDEGQEVTDQEAQEVAKILGVNLDKSEVVDLIQDEEVDRGLMTAENATIENTPLPERLYDDDIFKQVEAQHAAELQEVRRQEAEAMRIVQLEKTREEIAKGRERKRVLQWETQMVERERRLQKNQQMLDQKRRELEAERREQMQKQELVYLAQLKQRNEKGTVHETIPAHDHGPKSQIESERTHDGLSGIASAKAPSKPSNVVVEKILAGDDNPNAAMINAVGQGRRQAVDQAEIERRAKQLIQQRQQRPCHTTPPVINPDFKADLGSCPSRGFAHIDRIGLLPTQLQHLAERDRAAHGHQYPEGEAGNTLVQLDGPPHENPLDVNTSFQYTHRPRETEQQKCQCTGKTSIKTGKFAKFHNNLVRQEVWPHVGISKKYVKKPSFDSLEFEQFVAGETRIIYTMLHKADERQRGMGRLRLLVLLAHWQCKCKNWPALRAMYEGIVDEIEQGDKDWDDDFSGHETMLASFIVQSGVAPADKVKIDDKRKSPAEVYWCKDYQNNKCTQTAPHLAQIKLGEAAVMVQHICAACWANKKRQEHPESDANCPSKN